MRTARKRCAYEPEGVGEGVQITLGSIDFAYEENTTPLVGQKGRWFLDIAAEN